MVLALAYLVCLFVVWKRTREEGLPDEKVIDVFFLATLVFILFGRIGFVAANWPLFQSDLGRVFLLLRYPGLLFEAGLLAAALVAFLLARLVVLDMLFLGITLATSIWFLGEANFMLAGAFALFFVILWLFIQKIRKSPDLHELVQKPGWITLWYLIFTSVSFLITSYNNKLVIVLVVSLGLFLFRYLEFLKGVKWLSFPKAFLVKLEDTWKTGGRIWRRESRS
jgi:prolipoprotein diacylglyceryltransferase